jgi:hypothetical protein
MAGEKQRVHQRKLDLLQAAEAYGIRGSVFDDDAPTDAQHEKNLILCALRLTLARIEALLAKEE